MLAILKIGHKYTSSFLAMVILVNVYKLKVYIDPDAVTDKLVDRENKLEEVIKKYSNFYLEGSQNINLKNFKLLINNDICDEADIKIITIVTTAIENYDYRDVIRNSWGSPKIPGVKTRLAFMIGFPPDHKNQIKIEHENALHGDLVMGDFLDTYRNLTYKTVLGHMWVSSFCSQAEFVVKTDDEIYVDLYGMYALTRKYVKSKRYIENAFMMGVVNRYWKRVVRSQDDELFKWYVSYDEYPRDEAKFPGTTQEVYPDYIIGWFLVVNPGTSKRIVEAAKTLSYLHVEDVWVTGLLREKLNIPLTDARWMRGWTSLQDLLMVKTVQNKKVFVRDYVTAMPIERNITQYRTCYMLAHEARRCYHEKCLSNIYHPNMWISKPNLEREFKIKKLASVTKADHVRDLSDCAQSVVDSEVESEMESEVHIEVDSGGHSYRECAQQFFRGIVKNSLHHNYSDLLGWLKG